MLATECLECGLPGADQAAFQAAWLLAALWAEAAERFPLVALIRWGLSRRSPPTIAPSQLP